MSRKQIFVQRFKNGAYDTIIFKVGYIVLLTVVSFGTYYFTKGN